MVLGLLEEKGFSNFWAPNVRSALFIGLIIIVTNELL